MCAQPMVSRLLMLRDEMESFQFAAVDLDSIMQEVSSKQDEPTPDEIEDFKRRWNLDRESMEEVNMKDYFKAHQRVCTTGNILPLCLKLAYLIGVHEPRGVG